MANKVRILAIAVASTCSAISINVFAQTPSGTPPAKVERIEVTGSNIKRIDAESSSPIQVITAEEIRRSGKQTVTELLRELPVNAAGGLTELNGSGVFSTGAASASLRGLGSAATLVLLNGRRVAPYGLSDPNAGQSGGAVNLNAIPLDVIDRIEILKDGASAIYGSEAIAGVINIILRKDYKGASVGIGGSTNKSGKYDTKNISASFGIGDLAKDRYNAFVNLEGYRQDSVMFRDVEEFLNPGNFRTSPAVTGLATSAFHPAITYFPGLTSAAAGATCPTTSVVPSNVFPQNIGLPGTLCLYDQWQWVQIVPQLERKGAFARGTFDITATTQLFAEVSYSKTDTYFRGAPRTVGNGVGGTLSAQTLRLVLPPTTLPVGHPNNPYTAAVPFRYRFDAVGPNDVQVINESKRYVVGFKTLIGGWDLESSVLRTENKVDGTGYNEISLPALISAVANGTYNFTNPSAGSIKPENLRVTTKDFAKSSFTIFDVKTSGEIGRLSGGAAVLALGAEYRKEDRLSQPDPLKFNAGLLGRTGSSASGKRNVSTVFGEVVLPILSNLEAQIALRYDRYDDFGNAKTPKFALAWTPMSNLKVRSSYAQGFRAPSLTEISKATTAGFFNGQDDPRRCNRAVTPAITIGCGISIPGIVAASPFLQPEKARSYTAGFVFEPTKNSSISVDYFDILRKNEIGFIPIDEILLNEGSRDPRYANRITRDPTNTSATVPNDPGAILSVTTGYTNLGATQVKGVDIDARYRMSLGESGRLTFSGNITHYIDQKFKFTANDRWYSYGGFRNGPEWRAQFRTTWERGDWTSTGTVNYLGPMKAYFNPEYQPAATVASINQCGNPLNTTFLGFCTISHYVTIDAGTEYRGFKDLRLSLTVRNLANQKPSIDPNPTARPLNNAWYQPQGMNFIFGLRYTFY